MSWLDMLTKPGMVDANGNVTYFNDPVQRQQAFNSTVKAPTFDESLPASIPNVDPNSLTVAPSVPLPMQTDPSVDYSAPNFTAPPPAPTPPGNFTQSAPDVPQPRMGQPSFKDLTTDKVGNAVVPPQGLSKLGLLASLLKVGAQGIVDSMQSGALDAVPGRSSFGAGVSGAVNMPIFRAQRAADLAREAAATQAAQAQTAHTAAETAQLPMQANYLQAHANYMNATASKKDQRTPEDVYMEKFQAAQSKGINPATDPETMQALAGWQEYEKGKALAHPAASPKALTPHTVATAKGIFQLNPDTGRYDIYVGPPVQEIKYDHPGDGSDPVMDRRLAQVEKTSTDALVAHGKNIASRISKLDPQDPDYANQMAAIEREDYQNKSTLAKSYAKQRGALGYQTDVPQFDPWTDSYLSDDERTKLLGGGDQPAKSSGLLPWLKKGSSSTTKHLPGNPYAK